jgi:preprotein translocase subunit SecA
MNPRAAALPIPGLLLGAYPERREPRQAGSFLKLAALRTLVDRTDALQRRGERRFVAQVRTHEAALAGSSAESMQAALHGLRIALRRDGLRGALLAQALGWASHAARSTLGFAPFDTQLIAARIVLDNRLAEMATGEGKRWRWGWPPRPRRWPAYRFT